MNENGKPDVGPLRRREVEPRLGADGAVQIEKNHGGSQPALSNGHAPRSRVTLWTALDLIAQRWHWLVLGVAIGAGCFYLLGWSFLKPKFIATGQLLRYEAPGKSEYFKSAPISSETFAAMIRAPELLRAVGQQVVPPIPPQVFGKFIKIDPDSDSDMVQVQLAAREPQKAVDLLNLYLTNAVEYTRRLESQQAALLANEYLKKQVTALDQDLTDLQNQFRKLPMTGLMTNQLAQVGLQISAVGTNLATTPRPSMVNIAQQGEMLQHAQTELYDLLLKYTDLHPAVIAKRAQIGELEQLAATNGTIPGIGLSHPTVRSGEAGDPEVDIIRIKLRALEDARVELTKRQREAALYAEDPPGSVRVFAPADLKTVKSSHRRLKIGAVTMFGGGLGLGASLVLILLLEFVDSRLKTQDDVIRVSKLPVLTDLGNLKEMDEQARVQWAFRTWTMLQGNLSPSANHGLVCGITSATSGEGRSTWISLLAEAASLTGFRVLTIATRPSPLHVTNEDGELFGEVSDAAAPEGEAETCNALTTSVLSSPGAVTEQLIGPNSQPVVHIPLPGWVWNLERRKQWREALNHWRTIDNLVILVELPPANVPEAVLLGSHLPNLLWLSSSGHARAGETRAQLETLRNARCNLVGAVLNRSPGTPVRKRFPRWLECITLIAGLGLATARAQESAAVVAVPATNSVPFEEPTSTNLSFSIVNPSQRAAWQQHLTLGPGDVLTFGLYGQPELTRAEVAIAPDGYVNYLEVTNVLATGLSIDELRAKLDDALSRYRRAPHTLLTPIAFRSKKYYVLGKVATKGVFVLDRPITVLEALARAHGLENALVDRNVFDLADFRRSFLARAGKRLPLDFENLFRRGDLSQNVGIEPGDYLYFAPSDINEVYVVGEVRLPGPVTYTPDLTIMGAITERAGYTDRAYRAKVLVIRGSLNNPDRYAVDTHAIVDGKGLDFKLQPRDIIFVNSRPFIKVEELADLAITAFIQSAISSAVGVNVIQPIVVP